MHEVLQRLDPRGTLPAHHPLLPTNGVNPRFSSQIRANDFRHVCPSLQQGPFAGRKVRARNGPSPGKDQRSVRQAAVFCAPTQIHRVSHHETRHPQALRPETCRSSG
jgi:hypothetical protein